MSVKKLYCYVDETGQDTEGKLFIVSIVVTGEERDELFKLCEEIEKDSGKGKFKWGKAEKNKRSVYLKRIFKTKIFKSKLRYSVFRNLRDYDLATIVAVSKAVHFKEPTLGYTTLVYVDGLSKSKRREYGSQLRKLGIPTRKVQGVTKDENNALTRLADSIAGFVRDALLKERKDLDDLFKKAVDEKYLVEV